MLKIKLLIFSSTCFWGIFPLSANSNIDIHHSNKNLHANLLFPSQFAMWPVSMSVYSSSKPIVEFHPLFSTSTLTRSARPPFLPEIRQQCLYWAPSSIHFQPNSWSDLFKTCIRSCISPAKFFFHWLLMLCTKSRWLSLTSSHLSDSVSFHSLSHHYSTAARAFIGLHLHLAASGHLCSILTVMVFPSSSHTWSFIFISLQLKANPSESSSSLALTSCFHF